MSKLLDMIKKNFAQCVEVASMTASIEACSKWHYKNRPKTRFYPANIYIMTNMVMLSRKGYLGFNIDTAIGHRFKDKLKAVIKNGGIG